MSIGIAKFIPILPAIAMVICGLLGCFKPYRKYTAGVIIAAMAAAFVLVLMTWSAVGNPAAYMDQTLPTDRVTTLYNWITVGDFAAGFSFYIDPLTVVMLLVITFIGSLIAIYASGYMAGDPGYFRFFTYVGLFIFAMCCIVMSDNLLLLYLGWEGVGVASYLLIGFYYHKPEAVAAAKKAFIVNRIGDLGFALGIMLTYLCFGSIRYVDILPAAQALLGHLDPASLEASAATAFASASEVSTTWLHTIPFLLMLGAFGKSAQLPLYVWLPDAMEGPTPVSALIHAATMVTSGVYMICRLLPIFEFSPYALPTVALVGGVTAIYAASVALCQNDIKRVFAFSTVSQLGYMFLGVGVLSTVGGMFHLTTHAFFKALLFLTAGNVMHAMAGQLDLRKISGLRHKMPVTSLLMLAGCLSLAGFPLTSGFMSKDLILGDALAAGLDPEHGHWFYLVLAIMGLVTAFLTASYAFRVWFRVFMGPEKYEMGDEHHSHDELAESQAGADPHHAPAHAGTTHPDRHAVPHEMPWLLNGPLVVLAGGALVYGLIASGSGWIASMVNNSSAAIEPRHGYLFGWDAHQVMMVASSIVAISAIYLAYRLHYRNRAAAGRLADRYPGLVRVWANKYYLDEIYDAAIVRPLRLMGELFYAIDRLIIDGLVNLVGFVPRVLGLAVQPTQRGALQGYGVGMALGLAILLLIVLRAW